jgi:hypothetical protein
MCQTLSEKQLKPKGLGVWLKWEGACLTSMGSNSQYLQRERKRGREREREWERGREGERERERALRAVWTVL